MKPAPGQVRDIVRAVWSTQLGLDVQDGDTTLFDQGEETLTAAIHINGDFNGGIRAECSRSLIRRAAAVMFSLREEDLTPDDERDVVGELTNVIAGNIKALIPGKNSLSLPTIVEGTDYQVSSPDVKSSDDLVFVLDGDSMVVTVLEHT